MKLIDYGDCIVGSGVFHVSLLIAPAHTGLRNTHTNLPVSWSRDYCASLSAPIAGDERSEQSDESFHLYPFQIRLNVPLCKWPNPKIRHFFLWEMHLKSIMRRLETDDFSSSDKILESSFLGGELKRRLHLRLKRDVCTTSRVPSFISYYNATDSSDQAF